MARNELGRITAEDNPKPFSETNQPANRGRKARVFSQLSKDWSARGIERATPEAVKEAFEYLLALHLGEVKDIAGKVEDEANDMPMVVRLAAKELLGKKALEILREMLDRAHGKSKQQTELTGANGGPLSVSFDVNKLTTDEAAALLDLIEKAKE